MFEASALVAVLDSRHQHHREWAERFQAAADRGEVWVTSFTLCEVDRWLRTAEPGRRTSFWNSVLGGLNVVWVGPLTVEFALRDRRPEETIEITVARVVATQLGGELASDELATQLYQPASQSNEDRLGKNVID